MKTQRKGATARDAEQREELKRQNKSKQCENEIKKNRKIHSFRRRIVLCRKVYILFSF